MSEAPTPVAAWRAGPPAALVALLAYALLGVWQLREVLNGDRVLSPSAFVVRGGPFEPGWGELTPPGVDLLADNARQFTPWLLYAASHLKSDDALPLWKSTAFCGAPLVGNGQSALFFPTRLLAVLLGAPPWIHAAMAWLRLVLASFGAFLLLRHLRASALAAWVGGFVFGFGGFLVVFRFHPHADVAALLPWLVLAGDRLALRPGARRAAAFALVAGLQWLAGHPQTAVQCQLAAALLVLARAWSRRREPGASLRAPLLALAAALLLGLLVAAIQLVPLAEYARLSEAALERAARQEGSAWPPLWHVPILLLALLAAAVGLRRLARGPRALLPGLLLFAGVALALLDGLATRLTGLFILPLCADWFGEATRFMGPLNYVEGNGAWVGAALVLAAAGLLLSRERAVARVAGGFALLGLLAGVRMPLIIAALTAVPGLGLAENGRLVLLALLGLAVLAGLGLDALREAAAARARLAAAVLAPALAAFAVLVVAVQAGAIRSQDEPPGTPAPTSVARFGLLDARYAGTVRTLETREPTRDAQPVLPDDDEHLQVLGFAATREPLTGIQLLYGRGSTVAPTRWARADDLASVMGDRVEALPAGWFRTVFRAAVPREDVPPERVPVRVRVVTRSSQALESSALFSLEPSSDAPLLFPARPAPPPAEADAQLVLLGVGLALALLACGARGRAATVLAGLLVATVVLSLLPFGEELAPAVPRDLFYPHSGEFDVARGVLPQQRLLSMSSYALGAEVLTAYGLPDARGYDALTPPRIARLLRAALDWPDRESSMELLPTRTDPDLRLLGLMAVGELLDWAQPPPEAPRLPWPGMERLPQTTSYPIIVNPQALPRARLVTRAVVEPDDGAALARLRDPAFDLAHSCVLADAAGAPPALLAADAPPSPPSALSFETDQPDLVRMSVQPAAPSLLLLADTDFPGWHARVDGVERPILRANVAFRAVPVAPGDRVVEFRYEPASFALGRALSLAALLLCGLLLLLRRPR
jgi:hypothetical protein